MLGVYKMLDLHIRPSEFIGISGDAYAAFCFDECCAFIISKLKDGEKPVLTVDHTTGNKTYKRPSDLYNKFKN